MDASTLLRAARARAGLTLRALAEEAGTSSATLSAYETGRVTPRTDTLERILRAAGAVPQVTLAPAPRRDRRRAPAHVELVRVLELAEALPRKRSDLDAPWTAPVFGR